MVYRRGSMRRKGNVRVSIKKNVKPSAVAPTIQQAIELARSTRHLRAWRKEAERRLLDSLMVRAVLRTGDRAGA